MQLILLSGIIAEIAILVAIAKNAQGGLRFLLFTLSGFWFLSYFIRPILFIYSRNENLDSVFYDGRIGQNQGLLSEILLSIVVSCFVFCIPFLIFKKIADTHAKKIFLAESKSDFLIMIFVGMVTGFISLLIEYSGLRNPVSKSLFILLPISFSAFLWRYQKYIFSKKLKLTFFIIGAIGTVLTSSHLDSSKGVILTPLLVFLYSRKVWSWKTSKSIRSILMLLLVTLVFPLFSFLQTRHLGAARVSDQSRYSDLLPWYLSPFVLIAGRFDQFARITDAHLAAENSLGGYRSWFTYFVKAFAWNPTSGRSELSFGQTWNQLITNQSIPGSRLSTVSLAQGMAGEGYIWGKYDTLIVAAIFFSAFFIVLARLLDGNSLFVLVAFCVLANCSFFETGTIGVATSISAGIKIYLYMFLATKIISITTRGKELEPLRLID
jgi:hypothetical protein